jgi:hypothetical protein
MQLAQRIADVVKLLDRLPAAATRTRRSSACARCSSVHWASWSTTLRVADSADRLLLHVLDTGLGITETEFDASSRPLTAWKPRATAPPGDAATGPAAHGPVPATRKVGSRSAGIAASSSVVRRA